MSTDRVEVNPDATPNPSIEEQAKQQEEKKDDKSLLKELRDKYFLCLKPWATGFYAIFFIHIFDEDSQKI